MTRFLTVSILIKRRWMHTLRHKTLDPASLVELVTDGVDGKLNLPAFSFLAFVDLRKRMRPEPRPRIFHLL